MAKDRKTKNDPPTHPVAISRLPSNPPTPTSTVAPPAAGLPVASAGTASSAGPGSPADPRAPALVWTEELGDLAATAIRTARGILPARRLPVYLASAALLITGLIDPPAALGVGVAFEAIRRWEPARA